jgi:hypothetical protein
MAARIAAPPVVVSTWSCRTTFWAVRDAAVASDTASDPVCTVTVNVPEADAGTVRVIVPFGVPDCQSRISDPAGSGCFATVTVPEVSMSTAVPP